MNELTARLGYAFQNEKLLRQALTHPSMGEENNQRLEFLGDAVLEMCISDRIFALCPELHEGKMTALRQRLVCEDALYHGAQRVGLQDALRMDRGCEGEGGRDKPSILSDAMEAVLAAVYLDGGLVAADGVIRRFWPDEEILRKPEPDAKSALQEYTQPRLGVTPRYVLLEENGPAHDRHFVCAVLLSDTEYARAEGTSKKKAEQAAARLALEKLTKTRGTDPA